jgi:hypothetical protein
MDRMDEMDRMGAPRRAQVPQVDVAGKRLEASSAKNHALREERLRWLTSNASA